MRKALFEVFTFIDLGQNYMKSVAVAMGIFFL